MTFAEGREGRLDSGSLVEWVLIEMTALDDVWGWLLALLLWVCLGESIKRDVNLSRG